MLICGKHELAQKIAETIINDDPDHSYNLEKYKYQFSDNVLREKDKVYGEVGVLCPECNAIYLNQFADDKTPIMEDIYLNNIEKIGSRMLLKNGKYGKFWGCSNYPKCRFIKK
jgi:ssDNA-binding Zn-finger/Zn-ribbon topoisomerase 1